MKTLFPILPDLPPGFHYFPDFITEEEEDDLVKLIQSFPLHNLVFRGFEAKRKVMSLGYDYHFDNRSITKGTPIPGGFSPLILKIAAQINIPAEKFQKILLTEYSAGSVINWHRDAPPFDKIAGISLLSDCTFKLRPYGKTNRSRSDMRSFTVEKRSLYILEGEARENWEHSIAPVKDLRYSITLRTLRENIK